MIDGHGDDLFRYKGKVKINFSTNIPQTVNHEELMNHLYNCGAIFRNYPEPSPRSVEKRLGKLHGLSDENIIVTNGATEAIYLIAQLFSGQKSTIIAPTFREYQDACKVFRHEITFINSLKEIEGCHPDLVWLCNPNNPTGRVFKYETILEIIDQFPKILYVVDQAYAQYAVKRVLSEKDILERKNVILLNSLTKQFVVPGLRIGYAIGPQNIMKKLRAIRMPWAVNSIAIESAHYLLSHKEDYTVDYNELHRETLKLERDLKEMGINTEPSDCNFFLAQLPDSSASELKDWLIENKGILIRDASNFTGLTPRHFRVAAQTPCENNKLIKALKEWRSL